MTVQLLLFVIAILLVVIFWELCKIKGLLKKALPAAAQVIGTLQTTHATTTSIDRQ